MPPPIDMAENWDINWSIYRRDGKAFGGPEIDQLAFDLAEWFLDRGYVAGGGMSPYLADDGEGEAN